MRLFSFRNVNLPIEGAENSFPVSARSSLLNLPNGSFDQDGATLYVQPVKISHRCVVSGSPATEVDNLVDELLTALSKGRAILQSIMRDGIEYRQTWAKVTGIQRERKERSPFQQPLVIEFEQNYPFWLASADEPKYLDNGEILDDGWNLDEGQVTVQNLTTTTTTFTINNAGGVDIRRGTIDLLPGVGSSITNIEIKNLATNEVISYIGILSDGDDLSIDLLTKTIRLNYIDAYSNFTASQTTWMTLATGNNPIQVKASAITGTIVLRWRWAKHYL